MKRQVIESHFKKNDRVLYSLIKTYGLVEVVKSDSYFYNLCRSICSQQLSTKVARVIFERFKDLLPEQRVIAEEVLKLDDENLRAVGLSYSKVSYIKDLSQKVVDGSVDFSQINNLTHEEVVEHLTKVKGIGVWTCEMFMMSTLGREDVFSNGDLGLKRAIQKLYGLEDMPTIKQMEKITEKWRPYRTYASKLLWRSLANDPN